jgi:hypothetical protein
VSRLGGVGGGTVRTVGCAGLNVLVSDVSLAEFGEAALRRNLDNLEWLDETARQHHDVIDAASRLFPLLPTRLATVYGSDAAVCAGLAGRHGQLLDALHRVGGRVEWGVKAYAAQGPSAGDRTRAEAAGSEPGAAAARDAADGSGIAYLKRRRAQLTAQRESQVAAVNGARAVHAQLSARAEAARLHPPQAPQLSGVRLPMLLNAAYLLGKGHGASFTAAVTAEAAAYPQLRLELTGPWPPYSFAGDDDDGH